MVQSEKYTVSAVIPTLNRSDDLVNAVRSVMDQERLPDQLLIVDQSENEASKEAIRMLVDGHTLDSGLNYIHDPSISGLVEAKKRAVEESDSDIIMFLEDDVVLEAGYIGMLEKGFLEHPRMMGACGVVRDVPLTGLLFRTLFHLFHRGIFYDPRVGIHGNQGGFRNGLIQSHYLSGGTSAYRREVFDSVPFDVANHFFALEDVDFSTRAAALFGREHFFINTDAVLEHRLSPVNRARLTPKYQRKFREYICFYKKRRSHRWALPAMLWLGAGLLLEGTMASLRYRSFQPLTGSLNGIAEGIRWEIEHSV